MRMHAQTAMIENGFVHIPESAPWLAEYLHEMLLTALRVGGRGAPERKARTVRRRPSCWTATARRCQFGAEPEVRTHLPPAESRLRTRFLQRRARGLNGYDRTRNRKFESSSLQRGVCELPMRCYRHELLD